MGRERSGFVVNSKKQMRDADPRFFLSLIECIILSPQDVEAAKQLTKEQLAYILFKGGNTVSGGTTINSSRTKPSFGPSNR